jgi:predicted  nucleic acid-binding Zn-ribbon protein
MANGAIAKYYYELSQAKTALAEHLKKLLGELSNENESLKDELEKQKAEAERLQTLAAKFQGEADDLRIEKSDIEKQLWVAQDKAEHWEQEYHSLNRHHEWLLK